MVRGLFFGLLCFIATIVAPLALAGEACLLLAETYHEQLYCELKAMGRGKSLPAWRDFRRNDAVTQALLLKRPAGRVGIEVQMPPRDISPAATEIGPEELSPRAADTRSGTCRLQGASLFCGGDEYHLVGNRDNTALRPGALASDNAMNIPQVPGQFDREGAVHSYLVSAYRQYLEKMLDIGLGGSTFTFRKFVYLYRDVTARELDFSQRFETMFGFLKRDKQRMAVNERLPDTGGLEANACEPLDNLLAVCDGGRKNFLFRRAD